MEVLGVGPAELAFIVLIALILLGPKDMIAAGRTLGRFLRKLITSPAWQNMRHTGEELQKLPTKLMREAGLEELQAMQNEVQNEVKDVVRQIQPPDLKKAFDERQVFGPSTPAFTPALNPEPKPASPLNQPETPSEPPSTPEA
jgi:Sec-independent protein translocase protein TatA